MNEYHIIEKMATGSFGIVFRIRRLIDDAILVLKRIPLEDLDPPQRIQATQELCLMSQLHHPYIVAQRDAFLFNTSDLCLVMDYYDGGDLDALLFTQRGEDSYFDLRTVMLWFVQMLLAVHYLHAHGVIHRDIKSHNIFLNGDHQSVAVGDFGIAEKIDLTKVNGTRRKVVGGGGGAGARPSSSSLSGSPITTDLRHYQVSSTFTPSASISNAHMSQPTLPTQPSPRPDSPNNNNNNNNSSSDLLYQTKHNPHNMDSSCHSDFAPSPHLPPSSSSATTTTTTAGGAAPTTTSAAAGGGGGAAGVPFMAMKGTPLYMSPEALQSGVSSGPKSDVWALGCIVYELLSLRHPFETRDLGALVLRVTSGDRDPLPPHYPPAVHELVDAMLSVDEQQRPTCEELLHMPLVAAYLRLLLALRVPSDVPSCDVEKSLAKQLRHLGPTPPGAPSCTTYEHMMKEPECLPSVARERAERHQLIPPSSAFFHCGSSATSLRTSAGAFSFSVPQPSDAGRGGEMMMMSSNNRNNSPPRPSRSPVSSPRPPPPPQRQPHDRALVSSNDTSSFSNRQPLPPPQQVQQQQHQHQHQSQQSQQQQQQVSRRRRSSAVSPIVFTPAMMMEVEVANAAEAEEAEWVFCHHPNVVDLRGADVPTLVAEARRLRALIQGELRLQQQRRGMEELRTKFGDLFVELMQPARRQSSTRAMLGIRGDDDGDLHMHRAVSANNDGCTPRPNTHPPWPPPPSSAHSSARDDDLPAYARHQQQQQHVVAAASTLHDGLRSTSTAAAAALAFRDVAASHTFFGATLHAHLAPYLVRRARLVEHILLLLTPTQLDGVYSYYMQHNLARRSPRAVREIVPDRRAWQVLPTVEELVVVDVFLGRQLATKHNAQPAAEVEWG